MTKTAVIIPVVQTHYAQALCTRIVNNSIHPTQLIIVDSSECGLNMTYDVQSVLNVHYHRVIPKKTRPFFIPGMGTNEAWRYGFKHVDKDTDLVCVFNDDIMINRYFFEIVRNVFNRAGGEYAMAIPQNVEVIEKIYSLVDAKGAAKFVSTKKRVGYAYVLRKSVLDEIPPIPEDLKIFYGDNWIMTCVQRMGYKIALMKSNYIHHYKSVTMNKLKKDLKEHEGRSLGKGFRRKEYDIYLRAVRRLRGEN